VRLQADCTKEDTLDDFLNSLTAGVRGAYVRFEITSWQDKTAAIDKAKIENFFRQGGALSVDIRITALPRENIRAESVLEAETLRAEIQAMAELRGEDLDPDVLLKAEVLENTPAEELLKEVAK